LYIIDMIKLGDGFKNYTRTQIGIYFFLFGYSVGALFVILLPDILSLLGF